MNRKYLIKIIFRIFLSVSAVILLNGCAGTKEVQENQFFNKWKAMAEKSVGFSPAVEKETVFAPVAEDKEKAAGKQPEQKAEPVLKNRFPVKLITIKMHDVEVAVLLRTLAKAADRNIMINDNVTGKTSININQLPWDQVFRGILRTNGLACEWQEDIIRIMAVEDIHHDLKLLEARQKIITRKKEYELHIKSLQSRVEMVEPLITRVYHVKYAETEALRKNLDEFLKTGYVIADSTKWSQGTATEKTGQAGSKSPGSILVDPHTNSLIIQAVKSDIDRLVPLIKELDRPTPQILIEAHIVETNKDTARELGIQWGGLYYGHGGNNNYWVTPGANSSGISGKPIDTGPNPTSGMAVNFPAELAAGTGLTIGYAAEWVGKTVLDVQLSALQREGKLNILSSPSITTLDNQEAVIESGRDVPFQTVVNEEVNIEFKKAVLSLRVKPHVIDGKTLKVEIKTSKDELDFSDTVAGNPTIITKNAETTVVLFDGQTTVIGGLSKETTSDTESGVPILKDIPVFGYLFKGKSTSKNMEEVLIFITPHILKKHTPASTPDDNNDSTF